jgi:hypothetical protein
MIEISSNKIQHMKIADPIRSDDKYISMRYGDNIPSPACNDNEDEDVNIPTPAQTHEDNDDYDDSEIGSDSVSRKRKRPQPPSLQRAVRSILRKVSNDLSETAEARKKAFLDALMNEGALVYDDVPVQSKVSKVQKKKKTKAFLDD